MPVESFNTASTFYFLPVSEYIFKNMTARYLLMTFCEAILAMCIGFKMMVKYQVINDGRRMLGPGPSASNYGANTYGEFATVKQEKLLR
eukprot:UN01869